MLTLNDTRGVGVSRMMTSANFVNTALFFLTILFVQNEVYKQNMMTAFEVAPF